jgi:hypothetical protein
MDVRAPPHAKDGVQAGRSNPLPARRRRPEATPQLRDPKNALQMQSPNFGEVPRFVSRLIRDYDSRVPPTFPIFRDPHFSATLD